MNRHALLLVALAVASVSCSTEPESPAVAADRSDRIGVPSPTGDSGADDSGAGDVTGLPDTEAWRHLVDAFPGTGLWPLELEFLPFDDDGRPWRTSEFGPSEEPSVTSVTDILTTWSAAGPVDELAVAVDGSATTTIVPSEFGFDPAALGLVPVERPADVVARLGWRGATNYDQTPSEMSALLRSWEERFGAHVTRLGFATMHLSVARPPTDLATAEALAVEHYAWCPGMAEFGIPLDEYASELVGRNAWFCWWD